MVPLFLAKDETGLLINRAGRGEAVLGPEHDAAIARQLGKSDGFGDEARADTAAAGGAAPGMLLDSLRALEALGVVRAIRDFDESVYRQISEIVRAPDGSYTLVSADGAIPIRAGLAADVPARLPKLDLFMRTALATHRGRPRYVDLRWRGQVVVKWEG